jgi:protoporphyrin/coproporphyrin ferrochelatase
MSAVSPVAQSYDAVLLIAFGGPTAPEEIRPFLDRVTRGIPIPPERLDEVAHHYEAVGGKSPLNEITFRQAKALQKLLNDEGTPLPVYVGLRNAAPFFAETLEQMRNAGVKRALGFILSSHRTEASWERYQKNLADAHAEIGAGAPAIDYCGGWHDHPLFIQTWVELLQIAFAKVAVERSDSTPLIFTAHSLPAAMAARSPYVEQLNTSARMIADKLSRRNWSLAYQSRSGKPDDPWLEPDVNETLRTLAAADARDVVIAPIGFVCDHVEVLYDLDIEARKSAEDLRMNLVRASCPNDHPTFVRMIASVIEARVRAEDGG